MIPTIEQILSELQFLTSRSSGPGGQNVNKVNSKVTLKWDIVHSQVIEAEPKEKLLAKLKSFITKDGVLMLTSQESRSQSDNKEAVIQKLDALIRKAFEKKKVRRSTKPSKGAKQNRLSEKKKHSEKKQWRGRVE